MFFLGGGGGKREVREGGWGEPGATKRGWEVGRRVGYAGRGAEWERGPGAVWAQAARANP